MRERERERHLLDHVHDLWRGLAHATGELLLVGRVATDGHRGRPAQLLVHKLDGSDVGVVQGTGDLIEPA